jgi:hypothetical protein
MDGAREAIKESGKNIRLEEIATGPTVNEELSRIQAYYIGHPDIKGMFAVDAGSTEGVAKTMAANNLRQKGIHAGGFDLLPTTLQTISKGDLDFTIDQQPYLQGFYTVMVLFMCKVSGGLTGPADIDTGLKFVTKSDVAPYLDTKSAMILNLIRRLKEKREVSLIIVAHNYAHIFDVCDRVNLLQNGAITFDRPTHDTSVGELMNLVLNELRSARENIVHCDFRSI